MLIFHCKTFRTLPILFCSDIYVLAWVEERNPSYFLIYVIFQSQIYHQYLLAHYTQMHIQTLNTIHTSYPYCIPFFNFCLLSQSLLSLLWMFRKFKLHLKCPLHLHSSPPISTSSTQHKPHKERHLAWVSSVTGHLNTKVNFSITTKAVTYRFLLTGVYTITTFPRETGLQNLKAWVLLSLIANNKYTISHTWMHTQRASYVKGFNNTDWYQTYVKCIPTYSLFYFLLLFIYFLFY